MKTTLLAALTLACTIAEPAFAEDSGAAKMSKEQQQMMAAYERMGAVGPEHKQLAYFVGDWDSKTTMWMDPSAPPQTSAGKSHSTAIMGGRYIETRFDGVAMGQPFTGRGVLGFDNLKGKYFSTWIDSMSTAFWLSYGSYDSAKKAYTYHGSMDDPMKPGAGTPVRVVVRIVDSTHYSFEWYEKHAGKEAKTMQIDYSKT